MNVVFKIMPVFLPSTANQPFKGVCLPGWWFLSRRNQSLSLLENLCALWII